MLSSFTFTIFFWLTLRNVTLLFRFQESLKVYKVLSMLHVCQVSFYFCLKWMSYFAVFNVIVIFSNACYFDFAAQTSAKKFGERLRRFFRLATFFLVLPIFLHNISVFDLASWTAKKESNFKYFCFCFCRTEICKSLFFSLEKTE